VLDKLDIANLALGKLGVSLAIADYTENSVQAKIIRRHFRMTLDTLLEKHPWNFATKFSALSLVSEDAKEQYRYLYSLPSDCLVLQEIAEENKFSLVEQYEDQKYRWQELYTTGSVRVRSNVPDAFGKYTVRLDEDKSFPNYFGRALAAMLAMDIAPSLITNNFPKVKRELVNDLTAEVNEGIAQDMSRQPLRLDSLNPFVRARM